jgi:hypothetical protein
VEVRWIASDNPTIPDSFLDFCGCGGAKRRLGDLGTAFALTVFVVPAIRNHRENAIKNQINPDHHDQPISH